MSLKGFHIIFVTLSTFLSVGFGVWAFSQYTDGGSTTLLAVAVAALVFAVVLIGYGIWFLRKLRDVSFL